MTDIPQEVFDMSNVPPEVVEAAEAHFDLWYPNTAWAFDPLIQTLHAMFLAGKRGRDGAGGGYCGRSRKERLGHRPARGAK